SLGAAGGRGAGKRPYVVRPRDRQPIAFAGLWESWMGPNGEEMETAAIITTDANRTLHHIHHRMPVGVAPDAVDFWLECGNVDALGPAAVRPRAPEDLFEAYAISSAVNRVANDSAALLEPAGAEIAAAPSPETPKPAAKPRPRKDDGQASLF